MFKRILVPVDGSNPSTKALTVALLVARESAGRIRILHTLDELALLAGYEYNGELLPIVRKAADKLLQDSMEAAKAASVPADSRLIEAPGRRLGDVVADEAKAWEADLVVVGTHGRRGVARVLLGSGAEQVVRAAAVPVLTIRGSEESAYA